MREQKVMIDECNALAKAMVLRCINACEYAKDRMSDIDFRTCVYPDKETGGYIIHDGVSPIKVRYYYSVPLMKTTIDFMVGGRIAHLKRLSPPTLDMLHHRLFELAVSVADIRSEDDMIARILFVAPK